MITATLTITLILEGPIISKSTSIGGGCAVRLLGRAGRGGFFLPAFF